MNESIIDPAVVRHLYPAFGLLPDPLEFVERLGERWHRFLLRDQPPAELSDLHDVYQLARMWERLLAVVRHPTREIQVGPDRFVSVVGSCVFQVRADGTMRVLGWTGQRVGKAELEELPEWTVVLQGVPYRQIWLDRLAALAALEIEHATRDPMVSDSGELQSRCQRYARWAFGLFARHLRRHADLNMMRKRIARTLGYDRSLIPLAGRIPHTTIDPGVVTVGAYNRAMRQRAAFETMHHDIPHLLPIFGALCEEEGFPKEGEPQQRLRMHLLEQSGFKPKTWRMLAKSGPRLLQALSTYYRGDIAPATIEHIRVLSMLDLPVAPPAWAVDALIGTLGDVGNRWPSYATDFLLQSHLWQHVMAMMSAQPRSRQTLFEFDLIQRWIGGGLRIRPFTKDQRAAGWEWLVRRATAWSKRHQRELRSRNESWPVPFDYAHQGDLLIRPLKSPLELWDEAVSMRHCVNIFEDRCKSGKALIASIHRGADHVATAQFERTGSWWILKQVKGFANAQVGADIDQALRRFALMISQYQGARDGAPARSHGAVPAVQSGEVSRIASEPDQDETAEGCSSEDNGETLSQPESVDVPSVDNFSKTAQALSRQLHDRPGTRLPPDLLDGLESWLVEQHREGALGYTLQGPIVLEEQADDWRDDIVCQIEWAGQCGDIEEERVEELLAQRNPARSLSADEQAMLAERFIENILAEQGVDHDTYGHWGAEEIQAPDGQSFWAVYWTAGHSFTSIRLRLLDVCAHNHEIGHVLSGAGRYAGSTVPCKA